MKLILKRTLNGQLSINSSSPALLLKMEKGDELRKVGGNVVKLKDGEIK